MKNNFKVIIIAIVIGILLGIIFYSDSKLKIDKVINETIAISLIQIGSFNSLDNAEELSNKVGGVVIKEDDYKVYSSIVYAKDILTKQIDYLNKNKINYYLKEIVVSNKYFINYLKEAEKLLQETNDTEVIKLINKSVLKKYKEIL